MRLLLDTHAMYWYIENDSQLSGIARLMIQDRMNEIRISPASFWEIAIKISIGEWILNRTYEEFIEIGLIRYGFQLLPIPPEHAARLVGLPYPPGHKDPFDRMLVAQVLVEQISIISSDTAFDAYQVNRIW